jgi:hypothetical protein
MNLNEGKKFCGTDTLSLSPAFLLAAFFSLRVVVLCFSSDFFDSFTSSEVSFTMSSSLKH